MANNNQQIKILEKSDLAKLAEGKRDGGLSLSFYLGLKPEVNFRSEANSVLVGEADRVKKDKELSEAVKKNILVMLGLIKKEINLLRLPDGARTLVFFLGEKSEILIYRVPIHIRSAIVVEADYYLNPLIKIIEEFPRYLVVAIERNKAEFFTIFAGEIEGGTEVLLSDVPQKIRTSTSDDWHGRRENKIERHTEDHLKNHFKAVAAKIRDYFKRNGFDYLIIGGHEEVKAKFPEFLDKKPAEKLIGFLSLPHPNRGIIKEKSQALINKREKANEEKMVRDLLGDIGGKKWLAAAGMDSVLENLYLHKIKMLVVGKNNKKQGFICGDCHHISLLPGACAQCGGKTMNVGDLAAEIIGEAIKNKIKFKQLFHVHKNFDRFGIGAFLRDY